jgi:hypothetical protein
MLLACENATTVVELITAEYQRVSISHGFPRNWCVGYGRSIQKNVRAV